MRLIFWFLGFALLMVAAFQIWGQGWEGSWSEGGAAVWLQQHGRFAWAVGLGLLVSDLLVPVPGTLVMSGLGYLYGPWLGGALAATGSFGAGLLGYGLCRVLGDSAARRILGEKDLARGRRWFGRFGGPLVAASRALPILPETISCLAGLVRMPFGVFTVALAAGSLPVGFLFAWIGHQGHDRPAVTLVLSVVLPALLWAVCHWLVRHWERSAAGGTE